ncbi:hypothetical protein ENBRE01_1255 [Enteropsectra breve]|nr:hypothetical protein ENBRE01_1255 [Enteropsectra breve]
MLKTLCLFSIIGLQFLTLGVIYTSKDENNNHLSNKPQDSALEKGKELASSPVTTNAAPSDAAGQNASAPAPAANSPPQPPAPTATDANHSNATAAVQNNVPEPNKASNLIGQNISKSNFYNDRSMALGSRSFY